MTRRRSKLDLTLPVLMAAGLLALSCTANQMHRPVSVEDHPDYSLAFIEFDDQGELWAPSQLDRALALLEHENRGASGIALAVYVHGWNNSASRRRSARARDRSTPSDRSVAAQSGLSQRFPGADLPVVGIYLSWRGKVSSVPLVRELSFYNRRGAAERIAGPRRPRRSTAC